MTQLRRTAATAAAFDLECELLSPEEAHERSRSCGSTTSQGAIWLPGDGKANPTDLTGALARGARQRGARVVEHTRVLDVLLEDGRVTGVRTDAGDIEAEVVVNCAGQWAKAVGALAGVNVPLHSAEHFYVVTDPFEGVHPDLPVLRDPDGYTYFKEEVGGLVVGGFEPDAKPWVSPDEIPYPFEFSLLEEDWEHFAPLMESAVHRVPALEETGIRKFYNGPESFTPDNQFILGEAPEVRGFFVGAGFNSVGIATAGGAGRALAEWIVEGEPTLDLTSVDVRRFARFNGNNQWLHDRVAEVLGLHYAVPWPNREMRTARPFRRSPLYAHLVAANANFGSKMGWERANFFAPAGEEPEIEYSWGKQNWLPWTSAEHANTRENVTVFDQTSFSKYRLIGPDAEDALQWICTADVAVPVGRTVYTGMLNAHGTYESDVTLTRVASDEYLIVSSAATTERDQDHIRRQLGDRRATLVDVTSQYAVLGVMGPKSRELLSRLTRADLSDDAFPFGTSREISLGYSTVRATRITYVGELGWELYVPVEFAVGVYEDLISGGRGPRSDERRLLHDRPDAAGEGLPRLRSRAHPRLRPARGRADVHLQAQDRHRLPRSRGRGARPRRGPASSSRLVRGRERRADALGWRAGAARRSRVRPGDVGGVGRDARRVRRAGLRLGSRWRRRRPRLGDQQHASRSTSTAHAGPSGSRCVRCSTRTASESRGEAWAYLAFTTSITNHSVEFGGILAPLPWAPYA